MANYKTKTNTTTYDENYPYSGESGNSGLIALTHQKFYYKYTPPINDNPAERLVYVQETDMPTTITVSGECYNSGATDAVIVSRALPTCFYIMTSTSPFPTSDGSHACQITISPDPVPDGYTQFVRQSRVQGYASTENVEQS